MDRKQGFALIATITLMILLALLSVGLLTMATVQVRLSEKGLFAAEAKAQAKLALEMAIGRLQSELGPDQRVSANSGIMDSSPETETIEGVGCPHILGVWDSYDTWLNRNHTKGVSLESTYNQGRQSLFRRWLISGDREDFLTRLDSSKNLGTLEGDRLNKVVVLGEGTTGRTNDRKKAVYAGLVQVNDGETRSGVVNKKNAQIRKNIAWWVSAESQKARINLPKYKTSIKDDLAILKNTWNTPAPANSAIEDLSDLNRTLSSDDSEAYDNEVRQIISRGTLPLIATQTGENSFGRLFHDISLVSEGLQADVKWGGLKKDISLLFSQKTLPDEFRTQSGDVGLRPYGTEDGSPTVKNRPISSWNQMFYWSNMWDSSTARDGQDESATLKWDGQKPYSYVASDATATNSMMNNQFTYVRHPIMLKMYMFWGYQYEKNVAGNSGNGGHINVFATMIPVIIWWNPYNVALRMEGPNGEAFGSYSGQFRIMPMVMQDTVVFNKGKKEEGVLSAYYHYPRGGTNTKHYGRAIDDFGSSMRISSTAGGSDFSKSDVVVLQPGQVAIFSLPKADASTIRTAKQNERDRVPDYIPFMLGTITETSDEQFAPYAINMYSGWRYDRLYGDEFQPADENRILTYWLDFATKYATSDPFFETPIDRILSFRYTSEYSSSNKELGAFVWRGGLMDPTKRGTLVTETMSDPEVFSKGMPTTFNMNWGAWEESFGDSIKPPQERWNPRAEAGEGTSENDIKSGKAGLPRENYPFFGAYFGISAKWDSVPLVGTYPKDKDYRAKTWQHSSPLFWGSQMVKASELGRTYSPYWFEVKQGIDTDRISIANIISADTSGKTPFAGPGSECTVDTIVAAELPVHPPFSLSGFAGARLTPGWYTTGSDDAAAIAKRFAYQSGVPGVGIGNSFADPMLPANQIFSHNEITADPELGDFWDHGFMVNDGLWDSYFTSSLSVMPSALSGGGKRVELDEVLRQTYSIENKKDSTPYLPNKRFLPRTNGMDADSIVEELSAADGYKKAAKYMTVQGAFNVNSTSYEAWKATMYGLRDRQILCYNSNGTISSLDSSNTETYFSRFAIASNKVSHVDDYGSIGILKGIQDGSSSAWSDLRRIDENGMETLTKEILKEVKKRGPFLNMAEFVNRRLTTGTEGLKGALQAAIDNSGLNREFDDMTEAYVAPQASYPNAEAAVGSAYTAAPGYLIQSDILAVLGNILTVRDDTYTIRAYGEITDKSGRTILARAWCEAVVQRGIDYVDPSDSPETAVREVNVSTGEITDTTLSNINKSFGRQMNIVSFRWLSAEEV